MKASELMLGDWVLDTRTKNPLRVNPFMAEMEVPEWEPIPLTQEILDKNGFETHPSNVRMFFEHDCYRLCYYLNSSNRFSIFNNIDGSLIQRVIVNVHELQHALKLCGIDKEKGYNEKVTHYYDNDDILRYGGIGSGSDFNGYAFKHVCTSAPTKAEAIDWLESKGVIVELNYDDYARWQYFIYAHDNDGWVEALVCGWYENDFYSTRLEAEDAAIIKALELL